MNGSNFNCSDMFVFVYNKSNHSARIDVFRTTFLLPFPAPFSSSIIFTFVICPPISPLFIYAEIIFPGSEGEQKRRGKRCVFRQKKIKQSEPKIEWKWQLLCKLMKNTGKRQEETINIMSLFQHFGANHPLKCKISQSRGGGGVLI